MRARIVAALTAVLMLGGCAALPTFGEVRTEEPRAIPAPNAQVRLQGPDGEEEPSEIVRGFLEATRFGSAPFEYAMRYLTEDAAESWDPRSNVYVYLSTEELEPIVGEDGGVSVSVVPIARIDERGRYIPMVDSALNIEFSLVADSEGTWRIGALNDGVMISDITFNQTYVPAPLQFVSDDSSALVPDLRWFPESEAAERVVEELLAGPSQWLTHGVQSGFPARTTIGDGGVHVAEGVVKVDLSEQAQGILPAQVQLIMTQLHQSLVGLTDVNVVDLTVEGEPLEGAAGELLEFPLPQSVTTPYLLSENVLARWLGTELEIVDDSEEFQESMPRDPAVPYTETGAPIVYVAGENELRTVATDSAESVLLFEGESLVAPSYDRLNWVWTTPAVTDGSLYAISSVGEALPVSAPWLYGVEVLSLRVSPGGDRVAISRRVGETEDLVVAVIRRDFSGNPLSLGDPYEIAPTLTTIRDITWIDQNNVAALGARGTESKRPYLVYVGGPTRQVPQVVGADALTSMRSERSMLITTEEGQLWQRTAVNWQSVYTGVRDPAYSG